ncbi:uncharacterized protein MJAP1_001719 [Malassezia japonica]|uniref:Serine aminopeptidase S33 domain-containing protein n=1 Tax=Malassezia japonica TaxID=223818 RepID=A0AAF0EXH8_9BASI|nr:uncharacterized protein MJAP1_001719 [Malassezia japonica]WFD38755.1 hypothetical protein MJAP1_001719 [Malassezia japonica]
MPTSKVVVDAAPGVALDAPYGYVGGTQDNHVVQALVSFFCDAGLHVATYDARGVGSSSGKMTWTMRAESRDYQAVVDAMAARVETHGTPELYLCGYSAGAIQASTAEAPQGWETAEVRYVLLAYPLGVRWALTCLSGTYFQNAVERVVKRAATEPNVAALVLTTTADQFTSAASYSTWTTSLASTHESKGLRLVSLPQDHFFASHAALGSLADALRAWCTDLHIGESGVGR